MKRLSILALALLMSACGPSPEEGSSAKSYDMRGEVRQLPSGPSSSDLFIHHEPVPEFESLDGEVTGMDAMTMGFPVADAALLEGLEKGDKVAFTLVVDWEGSPPLAITRLEELPADTILDLGGSGQERHGHGESGDEGHGDHQSPDADGPGADSSDADSSDADSSDADSSDADSSTPDAAGA